MDWLLCQRLAKQKRARCTLEVRADEAGKSAKVGVVEATVVFVKNIEGIGVCFERAQPKQGRNQEA
jgi:hypothetical protein